MRKTILMGLGLAVTLAGAGAAQQAGQGAPRRAKSDSAKGERFEKRGGGPDGFLLRGITLTDAQKNELKALRTSQQEKVKASRGGGDNQMNEAREARQRGDTAAARAIMQRNRLAMEQARAQHVAAVRNILTAEQRTQFDKNVAELKQREPGRGDRVGARGKKGGRFGG